MKSKTDCISNKLFYSILEYKIYTQFIIFIFRNDKALLFNSAVLVEELSKELVAVIFIKYHHSNAV